MSLTRSTQLSPSELEAFNSRRREREADECAEHDIAQKWCGLSEENLVDTVNRLKALGRHELCLDALRSCGCWNQALEYAKTYAKDALSIVYFEIGQQNELRRNFKAAIRAYERAQVHLNQVPRMLVAAKQFEELENYIKAKNCKELWTWWGRYCESTGAVEAALESYQKANDPLSLVKFYWAQGGIEKAEIVAHETKDSGVCFYLARQFEAMEMPDKAIEYFAFSGHLQHGIALAKECGKDDFILEFAQGGKKEEVLDAALYFEKKEDWVTAVRLYSKAGDFSQAVDLCLQGQELQLLEELITDSMSQDHITLNKATVQKIVNALLHQNAHMTALSILCQAGEPEQAIQLVENHEITIDEVSACHKLAMKWYLPTRI